MSIYPKQKLSSIDKTKRVGTDKTWGEVNIDYLVEQTSMNSDHEEMMRLYRVMSSELDREDYNYVLNPFNTKIDKYTRFSAKLRNFNIITPIIELFVGEYGKRLKNYQAVGTNPEAQSKYEKELGKVMKNYYAQKAINGLNAAGIETGQPTVEQPSEEEVAQEFDRTYTENHIITGNEILDYIKYAEDVDEKYVKMYYDWLIVGRAISYKDVNHNDVNLEPVDPLEGYFPKNYQSPFIEDGDWFVRRQSVTPNYILDKFHDRLSEKEVKALDTLNNDKDYQLEGNGYTWLPTAYIGNESDKRKYSLNNEISGITLYHAVWRSFQKVGILYTQNELGEIEEIDIDDTYKLDKSNGDIKIDWEWITEIWEGWKVKDSTIGEIYIDVRPLPYNRADLNNESEQKLPYNGRYMCNKDGEILSLAKTGYPYQILYNIVHYQTERMINRNMDKIAIIPIGMIPKDKEGWDEEKFMYHSRATGFMFVDEASPTALASMQALKVLDMSLGTFINQSRELLMGLKDDWWEAIGMNRQRFGDTKSSDGKGVTEQAIFRSAIISEELNRKFEKFEEKDYSGLLDLSKIAFLDGKKAKYINSEEREAFLNMNADDVIHHVNTSYNVFVKNSGKENQKLEEMKSYMFSYAQNAGSSTVFMEALDLTNFTKGKEVIRKLEDRERELANSMEKEKTASLERMEEAKRESEQADRDIKTYEADMKYRTAIDSAEIKANIVGNNDTDTTIDVDPVQEREQDRKDRELQHNIKVDNKKLAQDDKRLIIDNKVASATITQKKSNNNQ